MYGKLRKEKMNRENRKNERCTEGGRDKKKGHKHKTKYEKKKQK